MSKVLLKLRNRRGETLAETLIALLVVAMASSILYVMINSSLAIIRKSSEGYDEVYDDISLAEEGGGTPVNGTVRIGSGTHMSERNVKWYGDKIIAFRKG